MIFFNNFMNKKGFLNCLSQINSFHPASFQEEPARLRKCYNSFKFGNSRAFDRYAKRLTFACSIPLRIRNSG